MNDAVTSPHGVQVRGKTLDINTPDSDGETSVPMNWGYA
jgi:hypothetical protein